MADTEMTAGENFRYRIRRDTRGVAAWFRENWRANRWFRWGSIALGLALTLWLILWLVLARGLPDARALLQYEPPLPSVVRGVDGEIVHTYARERRVQLQFKDFPAQLVNAYTSAEDETFWTHGGVDFTGTLNAVFDYATKFGSGERAVGGSTITQQVAKNILLGNEYSVTRKLREMILARRIEDVLTKREIMELYSTRYRSAGAASACRRRAAPISTRTSATLRCTRWHSSRFCPRRPSATAAPGTKAKRSRAATSCSTSWPRTTSSPPPRPPRPARG